MGFRPHPPFVCGISAVISLNRAQLQIVRPKPTEQAEFPVSKSPEKDRKILTITCPDDGGI
ncbi:MAG: hypothetical protein O7E53_00565, partial [Alphaproteobacteria bacterium]|nr:hypothetical protein [Alphaproteobacteria bacterium]